MKTIEEIFSSFYEMRLKGIDVDGVLKNKIAEGNYQFVLGFVKSKNILLNNEVGNADLYLRFRLLRSRQIGSAGEALFKIDYERIAGDGVLKKFERGNQKQLNPDFLELKKNKYIEVKTATIYKGNKFIFEQIRLKDPRISYYIFLGITPEGKFYWVLNKKDIRAGRPIFGAKFSPQHSTAGSNATYQWHPAYAQMEGSAIKPKDLFSVII
ncbi:MAG: hypothetical protein WC862_01475 [Patescibacteria group bacterium]